MPTATANTPILDAKDEALFDALRRVDGKAEIVNGRIIHFMPTGDKPSYASGRIFISLFNYVLSTGRGRAVNDNAGFIAHLPNRRSFSPDAAFYTGASGDMGFFPEAPIFAVEVRSENDYGPRAEREMAEKRADYFAAGTLVVWDVDLLSSDVVRVYRALEQAGVTIYTRGQIAEAEPAVPGWTMAVDDLFA